MYRNGYVAMMSSNESMLKTAEWKMAECSLNEVTLVPGSVYKTDGTYDSDAGKWSVKPSYAVYMDDRYDAYMQGGDGEENTLTMCGYAGCAAYRFTLPNNAHKSALTKIVLGVGRDRFLRSGVKISANLSNRESPGENWDMFIHPQKVDVSISSQWALPDQYKPSHFWSGYVNYKWRYVLDFSNSVWGLYAVAIDNNGDESSMTDDEFRGHFIQNLEAYSFLYASLQSKYPDSATFTETFDKDNPSAQGRINIPIDNKLSPEERQDLDEKDRVFSTESIPADSSVVGVDTWGVLNQMDVELLASGRPDEGKIEISQADFPDMANAAGYRYLYVYISIEDYTSFWDKYNLVYDSDGNPVMDYVYDEDGNPVYDGDSPLVVTRIEKRGFYIEGSAIISLPLCDFVFSDAESGFETVWATGLYSIPTIRETFRTANVEGFSSADMISPDLWRMSRMAGFIAPLGRMVGIYPKFDRFLENMPSRFMHGYGGEIVAGKPENEGDSGEVGAMDPSRCWGETNSFIRLTEMEKFANWPINPVAGTYTYTPRVMAVSQNYFIQDGTIIPKLGLLVQSEQVKYPAIKGYSRIVMGYATVIVPMDKEEYGSIKISVSETPLVENVDVSLNIWVSRSKSVLGPYSEAAFSALSMNAKLFTGSSDTVSGSCILNVGLCQANMETINISAEATLVGKVKIRASDESSSSGSDSGSDSSEDSYKLEGLRLYSGDVIIITPRVESVSPSDPSTWKGTFAFGKNDSNIRSSVNYDLGLGLSVLFT